LVCQKCGWINYENPLPAVVVVVRDNKEALPQSGKNLVTRASLVEGASEARPHNKKILLVRRGIEPHKGRWTLPSGFIEIEETPRVACLRELKEETNLEGKVLKIIGVYSQKSKMYKNILVVACEVGVEKGKPAAGDDAQEARFFPVERLPHIPFSSHRQIIEDLKQ